MNKSGELRHKCLLFVFLLTCIYFSATAKSQTSTYNYTGNYQTYIVPNGAYYIGFNVIGASGNSDLNNKSYGGLGATVSGILQVSPGQMLYLYVGSMNGYNGGGKGCSAYTAYNFLVQSQNGGGASDIRMINTSLTNRVVVAGGGGGSASQAEQPYTAPSTYYGYNSTTIYPVVGGDPNLLGQGGNGTNYYVLGGGGGGGYYGGIGGNPYFYQYGGQGGSSYTAPLYTGDVLYATATTSGDGYINITAPYLTQTISPFGTILNQKLNVQSLVITPPESSSGLPVYLSLISGPASIVGNTVSFNGIGTVVISADQLGNRNYLAAQPVITSFDIIKNPQTISAFSPIGPQTNGIPLLVNVPTSSSGLPVTISILSGPATIISNTITPTGAGNVTLAADQPGNANYYAAQEVTTSFVVEPANQTIILPAIPIQSYGAGSIPLSATDSSGLPISYSVTGPASLSNNILTITGAGTVTVVANQAGSSNYNAASPVTNSFIVNPENQILSPPISSLSVGESPIPLSPTNALGLPLSYSLISGPATLSNNILKVTGFGTVTIVTMQAGNSDYNPAVETNSIAVKYAQKLSSFVRIPKKNYGDKPFRILTPLSSAKLQVSLSVLSGPAKISNNIVTISGIGTVTITANQIGNSNYNSVSEVTSFEVHKASQKITDSVRPPTATGTYNLPSINSSAGLPVTISYISGPVSYYGGTQYTIYAAGKVSFALNQPGNDFYDAAPQLTRSFSVKKANQSITFHLVSMSGMGSGTFTGGSSSGLPLKYTSSNPNILSIATDGLWTINNSGIVTITAYQTGDSEYNAAKPVSQRVHVYSYYVPH